jgi:hypothetical protein
MAIDVAAIREPDFVAEVVEVDGAELRLTGNADSGVSSSFGALLAKLHAELVATNTRMIVVDMHALEFMSASTFNEIVSWLWLVQDLPPEQRYQLHFRPNPRSHWQRRSLRTLSCFATDLITIEAGES